MELATYNKLLQYKYNNNKTKQNSYFIYFI